ncbi:MAG: diacylglycerol kinase family protein [Pseudomonadota bacterium]
MSPAAARPRVLINPHSFRASRRGLARRVADTARNHGLEVLLASNTQEFQAAFDHLRSQQAEQIWMLAGDGTVQAAAQYLAQPGSAGWSPALLLLGGGRANIVPRDIGGYPAWSRFNTALDKLREGRSLAEERLPTLRVEQEGAVPRHGFFLAGAVVYAGIRLCQEHRSRGTGWLHRSWLADPYVLLKIAAQVWAGRSPLPSYDSLRLRTNGMEAMRGSMRLILASTLQMREALYNPFAPRGEGAVRLTAVAANARHFWRNLPAMFKGRFGDDMTAQQGYLSGRFDSVEIEGMDGYALDGELFAADPARPVRFASGIELRVLRP